ncbi:MAG: exopolyphosphatase [Eubacteriales bacterium]|nr:exopolyphosphatase [Eubacteriales bacterium]
MVRTFAAIDVGSFELELGIYEISDKTGIRSIDHVKHVIALGRDTYNGGKIGYHLVEEMCEVLADFVCIMKEYQVEDYRAYATSAMREAKNSQIVLDQIKVRTGLEVRVISNSEQRFISYKAIAAKDAEFQKTIQKGTAIVDVGFGSMQVSLFDRDALVSTQNLPLGVLRLREILAHEHLTKEVEQLLLTEMVDNELVTFRKMYLKDRDIKNLIAIGEPILILYSRFDEEKRKDRVSIAEVNAVYDSLSRMTMDQIEETFDVNGEYAAMMLPTASIYKRMMEMTGAENMWLPGIMMTDGIAADYAEAKKLLKFNHSFSNDIIVTSRNMAKRYKCHMPHIQAVEQAALQVFDCLKKYHGMKERERLLLQIAADLHSCGKFVTMRDATECAYNLIMSTEIIGLSHVEREIVANVVRYHVQPFRYNQVQVLAKPSVYTRLVNPENLTLTIAKLIAILRLANSMDRSHKGKLADCRLVIRGSELVITTGYTGDVTVEAMSIAEKGDFFEEIFGIRPVLKQKKRV